MINKQSSRASQGNTFAKVSPSCVQRRIRAQDRSLRHLCSVQQSKYLTGPWFVSTRRPQQPSYPLQLRTKIRCAVPITFLQSIFKRKKYFIFYILAPLADLSIYVRQSLRYQASLS